MNILVIAPTGVPGRQANTLQTMKMTQALVNLGHTVLLLVPQQALKNDLDKGSRDWTYLAHFYGLHTEFTVEWMRVNPRLRRYDFAYRSVRKAREGDVDLVYTRLPQAAALSSLAGMPTIFELHDLPKGVGGPWMLRLFLWGRGARRLITITRALAADLERDYKIPQKAKFLKVIPDAVDLARYKDVPSPGQARKIIVSRFGDHFFLSEHPFSIDRFTVGYTGHLYPGRGIELILALAGLIPEVNFLLVGGEPQDVELVKNEVIRLGLHNVFLTGFVPNAELPLYQAACEVLLMPYQYSVEASSGGDIARYLSPMKLFEYMACGRAICASDLPVLREVLSEEIACLIKPDDITAWASVIQRLIKEPDLRARLARKARKEVHQYSWENRARLMLAGVSPE